MNIDPHLVKEAIATIQLLLDEITRHICEEQHHTPLLQLFHASEVRKRLEGLLPTQQLVDWEKIVAPPDPQQEAPDYLKALVPGETVSFTASWSPEAALEELYDEWAGRWQGRYQNPSEN